MHAPQARTTMAHSLLRPDLKVGTRGQSLQRVAFPLLLSSLPRLPPPPSQALVGLGRRRSSKMATKVQKIMTQPINLIFRFLQSKQRIQIWLYDQVCAPSAR